MSQITARLPDDIVSSLDRVAQTLHRIRADIMRQAIELISRISPYRLNDSVTRQMNALTSRRPGTLLAAD